jgi:LPS export ABC transporter protein LptC
MHPRRRHNAHSGRWLVLAAMALTAAACQQEVVDPGSATPQMEELESPIVFGMTAFMTTNGVREGRIQADTAYTYADSVKVDLRGMTATFFDEDGNDRATVTGREGEWDQQTDRMVARGDVVLVIHSDGSKIESAEINYDPTIDRVWSDSATVRTMADGSVTRGSAFESDIDFTNVTVRNVRGEAGNIFN